MYRVLTVASWNWEPFPRTADGDRPTPRRLVSASSSLIGRNCRGMQNGRGIWIAALEELQQLPFQRGGQLHLVKDVKALRPLNSLSQMPEATAGCINPCACWDLRVSESQDSEIVILSHSLASARSYGLVGTCCRLRAHSASAKMNYCIYCLFLKS